MLVVVISFDKYIIYIYIIMYKHANKYHVMMKCRIYLYTCNSICHLPSKALAATGAAAAATLAVLAATGAAVVTGTVRSGVT